MAIVHAGSQPTKKPDIFDVVSDTDLAQTPVYAQIKKGKSPENDEYMWPADVPDAEDNTGTADAQVFSAPTNFGGRDWIKANIHHKETNFQVGIVAEGNAVAGTQGRSEFEYQRKRALRQHVKSWESIILGEQENQVGNNATPFRTRGLELWINPTGAGQSVNATPAAFRTVTGAVKAFTPAAGSATNVAELTEDDLNNVLAAIASELRSQISVDIIGTLAFRRRVSSWGNMVAVPSNHATVRRFNSDAEDKKLGVVIEAFRGDAGEARLHTSFFLRSRTTQRMDAAVISFPHLQLRVRHAPQPNNRLAQDGTGKKGQIYSTAGLQVGNPKFFGKLITPTP